MEAGEDISKGAIAIATATPTAMDTLTAITAGLLSSKIAFPSGAPPPPPSTFLLLPGGRLLHLLRRLLLLSFQAVLSLLLLLFSPALSHLHHSSPTADADIGDTSAPAPARALAHVLSLVARVPVASRKYELVRCLAERLVDDNLRLAAVAGLEELNRAALSAAFCRTLRHLEAAAVSAASPVDRSLDMIFGVIKSGMRRVAAASSVAEVGEMVGAGEGGSAEKLTAEALWLAQKMAESGAATKAVARWGAAAGLGRLTLSVEPRLQVALVRVSGWFPCLFFSSLPPLCRLLRGWRLPPLRLLPSRPLRLFRQGPRRIPLLLDRTVAHTLSLSFPFSLLSVCLESSDQGALFLFH